MLPDHDSIQNPLAAAQALLERHYGLEKDEAPRAYLLLNHAWRNGSVEACYLLGHHFQRDRFLALSHLTEAAEKDHSIAALELGELAWGHVQGRFARPWPLPGEADDLAVRWMERAAELGLAQAWSTLARILEARSDLGQKDESAAAAWVLAAEAGDPSARVLLGLGLRRGHEAEAGLLAEGRWIRALERVGQGAIFFQKALELLQREKAVVLIKKYAAMGNGSAMSLLSRHFRSNPKDPWYDHSQSLQWARKAARAGNLEQVLYLAKALAESPEPLQQEEALQWQRQAAYVGHGPSCLALVQKATKSGTRKEVQEELDHALAVLRESPGPGLETAADILDFVRSLPEPKPLLEHLAARGLAEANRRLAESAMEEDISHGIELFNQAATAGDVTACLALGNIYSKGLGVDPNPLMAITWLRKASDLGDSRAMVILGDIFLQHPPEGMKPDPRAAMNWYSKAAAHGDRSGAAKLEALAQSAQRGGLEGGLDATFALECLRVLFQAGWCGTLETYAFALRGAPTSNKELIEEGAYAARLLKELKDNAWL